MQPEGKVRKLPHMHNEPPSESAPEGPKGSQDVTTPPPAEAEPRISEKEQMEQYEQALKETDWGHQPC